MSYCRTGESGSQVYAYAGDGYLTYLSEGIWFKDKSRKSFYNRLLKLKAAGIKIPKHTFNRLERELGITR